MRSKVCSSGIPKARIFSKAWLHVAKESKENGSNLNLSLVENLLDKQNVAYALKTFRVEVGQAMESYGYLAEAKFCGLMRNWYRAQDEAGMPCIQRIVYQQELREWLLQDVRFDIFPPQGKYVKDIPIVLYESLLMNIDRHAQLYTFTNGSYNVRSIGTLDIENLFGAFQDWDAKGTGILRADEVPQAIYTACDLYNTRLNEKRGFFMHTSATRVYPVPTLLATKDERDEENRDITIHTKSSIGQLTSIKMRNHAFDMEDRMSANPRRKKGTISNIHEPARGSEGIRDYYYKVDESKILPHIRAGIQLDDSK